jgi:hypothetical protein
LVIQATLENFPIYSADGTIPKINDPIFPAGFGLSTDSNGNMRAHDGLGKLWESFKNIISQ